METLVLLGGVVGFALSFRFKVMALVVAIAVAVVLGGTVALTTGLSAVDTVVWCLVVAIAPQIGYGVGVLLQAVRARSAGPQPTQSTAADGEEPARTPMPRRDASAAPRR
jgi:hypothetical protein